MGEIKNWRQRYRIAIDRPTHWCDRRGCGALEPAAFTNVQSRDGLESLKTLIQKNTLVSEMPELFCFGLLEHFDLPELRALR